MGNAAVALVAASGFSNAAWGLIGVLVGGVSTTVGNLVVQHADRRARTRAEQLDVEAGMRVVAAQLDDIGEAAGGIEKVGTWAAFADADGWFATWEEERRRIAAGFVRARRAEQFDVVASGFVFAKLFRSRAEREDGKPLDDGDRTYLGGVRDAVAQASGTLRSLLGAADGGAAG